jgi:hypothetical protein
MLRDRNLGKNEIATASGDLGGPSFVDGKIAGISSWVMAIEDFSI